MSESRKKNPARISEEVPFEIPGETLKLWRFFPESLEDFIAETQKKFVRETFDKLPGNSTMEDLLEL